MMKNTRILLFSDIHENAIPSPGAFTDKRLIGCVNSLLIRRGRYDSSKIDRMVQHILAEKPDAVIFPGDAVSTAEPQEFKRAWDRLKQLAESGIPVIYTPGNHDLYVSAKKCRTAMEDFFQKMNGGRTYTEAPYLQKTGGIRFAVIHCAKPVSWIMSSGTMSAQTKDFLQREADSDEPEPLVCVGHFPILTEHPVLGFRRKLFGAEDAAQLVRSGKIALSICGHVHRGYEKAVSHGYGELCVGSLTKYGTFVSMTYDRENRTFLWERKFFSE